MKLKFLKNVKHYNNDIMLGKNGAIRFKNHFVTDWGLNAGDKIQIGIDDDEKPESRKTLFLVKSDEGFKVSNGSGQFFIQCKTAIEQTGFKMPSRFDYKPFKFGGFEGMQLTLK